MAFCSHSTGAAGTQELVKVTPLHLHGSGLQEARNTKVLPVVVGRRRVVKACNGVTTQQAQMAYNPKRRQRIQVDVSTVARNPHDRKSEAFTMRTA